MAAKSLDAILEVAALLRIPVAEAYREGVVANYERLLEQAALVMAVATPNTVDDLSDFQP
ncbi:MAG: hypothetical protein JWM91_5457 [Rhodospirillales bacterium]|nr:hypothetical protein [Rhodospirillales bacterium]